MVIMTDSFPVAIPSFAIATSYFVDPADAAIPVEIHVYLPGDEEGKPSIKGSSSSGLTLTEDVYKKCEEDPYLLIGIAGHMQFSPFQINCEGKIKVYAVRGGELTRLCTLNVRKAPPQTPGGPPAT